MQTYQLLDGNTLPQLGFGTYKLLGEDCTRAVSEAIACGYRSIDTATLYENEEAVGEGIRQSGLKREEIQITTKIRNEDQGYESTLQACRKSLEKLGVEYIDLYLIHWPGFTLYEDTYRAMMTLKKDGLIRSAGVSNFLPEHLEKIRLAGLETPVVNQIETHPYLKQEEIISYCQTKGILIECWSPLMRMRPGALDPTIVSIAERLHRTPAQVVLRWEIQQGFRPIPKTGNMERMKENLQIFDFSLSDEDMCAINVLTAHATRYGPDMRTHF